VGADPPARASSDRHGVAQASSSSHFRPGPQSDAQDDSGSDDSGSDDGPSAGANGITPEMQYKWRAQDIKRQAEIDPVESNFGSFTQTAETPPDNIIAFVIDLSLLLDFPGFSAMAAGLLDYLVTEGVFQRHTYVNGGRANPKGENPSFITSKPLTNKQREHEVIVLIVEALEAMLALKAKRVTMNVHEGDYTKQLTFTQLLHGDYSGKTFRVVVFFSPEGSVRYFQVVNRAGTVLFEHHVTNLSLAAVGMKGAARQTNLYGNCHGCFGIEGPSASLVVTFNVRCALPTMPSPPCVSRNQSTPLHQSPSQSPSLEHRDRPAAAGRAHRSKWVRCRVRSAKPSSVSSVAIRWLWRR
jgi:hypothetical protein